MAERLGSVAEAAEEVVEKKRSSEGYGEEDEEHNPR